MQKRCFSTQHRCIVTASLLLFSCSWLAGSLSRVVPHKSGLVLSVQPCTIVVTPSCWLSFRKKRSWSCLLCLLKAADVKLAQDKSEMKNRHLNTLYTHWCSVCIVHTNTHTDTQRPYGTHECADKCTLQCFVCRRRRCLHWCCYIKVTLRHKNV